ncbi:heat shock 70 kDa protein BIP5-like [Triticum dicoccoides]|uniref:heat shock 70 kDa protein BIP5-like n=1 Tax=Triticum dicoccoides TaxID=85692 RepID=UPI0018908E8B|nr:heat shock 70 kDa protein BIP5-like [Triticum dicoccoides]
MARRAAEALLVLGFLFLPLTASSFLVPESRRRSDEVLGITLGATHSCIAAVHRDGSIEIVPDDRGNRVTPAWVAFIDDGERLVGEAARDQYAANPNRTIYGARRILGRRFSDADLQQDVETLPYAVVDRDGMPYVRVDVGEDDVRLLSPVEITAAVFADMMDRAAAHLGRKVTRAVLTVPAHYTDAQMYATKEAGILAGLDVLRLVREPVAAAIAYGLDKHRGDPRNMLVFDLGGSTLDVAVLTLDEGVFETMASRSDAHLGGDDFDRRLAGYFAELFQRKHGRDVTGDGHAMQRLLRECERAKRALSDHDQHQVGVELKALLDGVDLSETLTRELFEELNQDLFLKTMAPLNKAMEDAELEKGDIHDVILVGGGSRIPMVQQLVKDYFDGKEPVNVDGINPDEAVAYGAAVQGSHLTGHHDDDDKVFFGIVDVPQPAIGIEAADGAMVKLIRRDAGYPAKGTHVITTYWDKRTTMAVKVYEGDRTEVKDNRLLCQLDLSEIPPASIWNWGRRDIEVTIEVDQAGTIHAEATDKASGKSANTSYGYHHRRLSQEEIDAMMREADEFARDAKARLEAYVHSIKETLAAAGDMELEEKRRGEVEGEVMAVSKWLDRNTENAEEGDYEKKLWELQGICDPVISAMQTRLGGGLDDYEDEL